VQKSIITLKDEAAQLISELSVCRMSKNKRNTGWILLNWYLLF